MRKLDSMDKFIVSGLAVLFMLILMLVHSDTKAKQALMRELDSPVSYWESMGLDEEFIKGRLIERKTLDNQSENK